MPRSGTFTRAAQLYNSALGALELGYADFQGYFRVANVNPDFVGKKARRGALMYDHEHAIMITLNQGELAVLDLAIDGILSGEEPMLVFSHKVGNSVKKLTIGMGLDGESKRLQVCVTELDRDDPDGDPIGQAWYEPDAEEAREVGGKQVDPAVVIIRAWIKEAIRVSLKGMAHSSAAEPVEWRSPGGGGGWSRAPTEGAGPSRPGRRDEGDGGGDGDRDDSPPPRRPHPSAGRGEGLPQARRFRRTGRADAPESGEEGGGGDDIPFEGSK